MRRFGRSEYRLKPHLEGERFPYVKYAILVCVIASIVQTQHFFILMTEPRAIEPSKFYGRHVIENAHTANFFHSGDNSAAVAGFGGLPANFLGKYAAHCAADHETIQETARTLLLRYRQREFEDAP